MKQGKQGRRHLGDALGHTGEGPGFPPSGTDTMNITLMLGGSHRLQDKCHSPPGGFKVKTKNYTKDQNEDLGGGLSWSITKS